MPLGWTSVYQRSGDGYFESFEGAEEFLDSVMYGVGGSLYSMPYD